MITKVRAARRAAILICAGLFASSAHAVQYSCDGPVNGVTVGPSGVVSAASAGGQSWGYFCTFNDSVNGVTPEACKGILAVLLAAQASGKQIRLWFDDSNSCSTNRGWNWLSTLYWGPSILD